MHTHLGRLAIPDYPETPYDLYNFPDSSLSLADEPLILLSTNYFLRKRLMSNSKEQIRLWIKKLIIQKPI